MLATCNIRKRKDRKQDEAYHRQLPSTLVIEFHFKRHLSQGKKPFYSFIFCGVAHYEISNTRWWCERRILASAKILSYFSLVFKFLSQRSIVSVYGCVISQRLKTERCQRFSVDWPIFRPDYYDYVSVIAHLKGCTQLLINTSAIRRVLPHARTRTNTDTINLHFENAFSCIVHEPYEDHTSRANAKRKSIEWIERCPAKWSLCIP